MSAQLHWISKMAVVDWPLKLLDGTPASTATVTGTVSKPDGTTAAMAVSWVAADQLWRVTYDTATAGWHAFRLTASGTADSAEEGRFYVKPSLTGSTPPTYDTTTDIGRVRLLISDRDEDNQVFTNAEITAFLALEGTVRLAAAQALDTIASNEALVQKVIRTQDLATDGAKLADSLRKHADSLRSAGSTGGVAAGAAVGIRTTGYDPLNLTGLQTAQPWIGNGQDADYADPTVRHLGLP